MCNLTGILNCLFMGFKLSAGKGSVYLDVLRGLGRQPCWSYSVPMMQGWLTCSTPSTSRPMTTCVGPALGSSIFCYSYGLLYGTSILTSRCCAGTRGRGRFKPMFIIAWLLGRVPTRESRGGYFLADLPDDVMAILKADGNV